MSELNGGQLPLDHLKTGQTFHKALQIQARSRLIAVHSRRSVRICCWFRLRFLSKRKYQRNVRTIKSLLLNATIYMCRVVVFQMPAIQHFYQSTSVFEVHVRGLSWSQTAVTHSHRLRRQQDAGLTAGGGMKCFCLRAEVDLKMHRRDGGGWYVISFDVLKICQLEWE